MKKSSTKNGVSRPSVEPQPFEYAIGAAGRPTSARDQLLHLRELEGASCRGGTRSRAGHPGARAGSGSAPRSAGAGSRGSRTRRSASPTGSTASARSARRHPALRTAHEPDEAQRAATRRRATGRSRADTLPRFELQERDRDPGTSNSSGITDRRDGRSVHAARARCTPNTDDRQHPDERVDVRAGT